MVSGQFSIHIVAVGLGLHLFNQVFWCTTCVAWLVSCQRGVTSRTSRNLGGWHTGAAGTFCSMLACTALGLHCGVTSAVFAGVHWYGVLEIVHWVAAGFGCRAAAGTWFMVLCNGACTGFRAFAYIPKSADGGSRSGSLTCLSCRYFLVHCSGSCFYQVLVVV